MIDANRRCRAPRRTFSGHCALAKASHVKPGRDRKAEAASFERLNGRYDLVGPVYRGDLLSPQFLLRPIIRRTASYPRPVTGGVVVQVPAPNAPLSVLDQVRNNAR